MPLKSFKHYQNTRLLDIGATDVLGVDGLQYPQNRRVPRHGRIKNHQQMRKYRQYGVGRPLHNIFSSRHNSNNKEDEDEAELKNDVNCNSTGRCKETDCSSDKEDANHDSNTNESTRFHFHSHFGIQSYPPPEYQSRPSTPMLTMKPTAPVMVDIISTLDGEHVITADHFQKVYGCKTATNIVLSVIGVILLAVFLVLLILLA